MTHFQSINIPEKKTDIYPTHNKELRALHVLDVRERKDGSAIKAVAVPAWPVLVRLSLLLLMMVLLFPVR